MMRTSRLHLAVLPRVLLLSCLMSWGSGCDDNEFDPAATPTPSSTELSEATATSTSPDGEPTPTPTATPEFDRFGGWTGIRSAATGRFRVEEIDGVWWFITPEGNAFFSAGINDIDPDGDYSPPIDARPYRDNILARYGSEDAWAEETERRLRSWNVNTVGAWSKLALFEDRFAHTAILSFNGAAPVIPDLPVGITGRDFRDYFSPDFPSGAVERAEAAGPCAENPFCIGVFSDNELAWGPSAIQTGTYLDAYMVLPPGAPGKLALQSFFEDRYAGDIAAFNSSWGLQLGRFGDLQEMEDLGSEWRDEPAARNADRRAFVAHVAERYYQVVYDTLRAIDPELLILGSRFLSTFTSPAVVAAAAPYVDVVSLNSYQFDEAALNLFRETSGELYGYLFLYGPFSDLRRLHELAGKPVMITEYTFRTPTEGASVLFPPFFPTVETQAERADAYERYIEEVLLRPFMIGAHWFEYCDQPATGRGDGENSRFGVVDIEDNPYVELTERMRQVYEGMYEFRLAPPPTRTATPAPTVTPTRPAEETPTRVVETPPPGALGRRVFSIAAPALGRTGFYVFILPGDNLSSSVAGGPLVLEGGVPGAEGVVPIRLAEDTVIGVVAVTGELMCLRLSAEGSSGSVACDGGVGHDVRVVREAGELAPPAELEVFLGEDSGAGAATLLVPVEYAQLTAGAAFEDCLTSEAYGPVQTGALGTAAVTVVKGSSEMVLEGESFVCGEEGAEWREEDGPGMLVFGLPTFDSRVPGGELAAALRFADGPGSM